MVRTHRTAQFEKGSAQMSAENRGEPSALFLGESSICAAGERRALRFFFFFFSVRALAEKNHECGNRYF